jgi:ubiquitin carboxyl-terminal hydrolase 10
VGEGPESGGGATPLVDATVRFFEEFMFKEAPQQPPQQPEAGAGKSREDDQEKEMHNAADSFEPTYLYDAMKEKWQLKNMLV